MKSVPALLAILVGLSLTFVTTSLAWTPNGTAVRTGTSVVEQIDAVADGSGGSYIAWADRRGTQYDIYATHLNASGGLIAGWSANGNLICSATGDQLKPRVLADGSGGAYVCWQDARNGPTDINIYVTRITSGGTTAPSWTAGGDAICSASSAQIVPVMTATSDGNIVVAWLDYRTSGIPTYYLQKVGPGPTVAWTANGMPASDLTGITVQQAASLTSDGNGGVYISYVAGQPNNKPCLEHIRGSDGARQFVPGTNVLETAAVTIPPSLAGGGGAGNVIVTYAVGSNIRTKCVNGGGTVLWTNQTCTAVQDQFGPMIVSDGALGGAVIAWADRRNSRVDLFAQHVTNTGATAAGWTADGVLIASGLATFSTGAAIGNGRSFAMTSDGGATPSGARFAYATDVPGNVFVRSISGTAVLGGVLIACQEYPDKKQNSPVLADGGAVVAWRDERDQNVVNSGIFASGAISGSCGYTSVPGVPTSVSATSSNHTITVNWFAPTSGGPVENYVLTNVNGPESAVVSSADRTHTFENLQASAVPPDTVLTFSIVGQNCFGTGAATTASATISAPRLPMNVAVAPYAPDPARVSISWKYVQNVSYPPAGLKVKMRYFNEPATEWTAWTLTTGFADVNSTLPVNNPAEVEVRVVPFDHPPGGPDYDYPSGEWKAVRSNQTPLIPIAGQTFPSSPTGDVEYANPITATIQAGSNVRHIDLEVSDDPTFNPSSPGYRAFYNLAVTDFYFSSQVTQDLADLVKNVTYYYRTNGISGRGDATGPVISPTTFTLRGFRITSPVNSPTWQYAQTQTVQWLPTSTGVNVDLFPNPTIVGDHLTGTSISLATNVSGTSRSFTVPYLVTTQARLQLTRVVGGVTEYAYSPNPITITVPPGNGTAVKVGPGVVNSVANTPDGAGGSYVCWADQSNGSNLDVFVARLDATGTVMANWPVNVTPNTAGHQWRPQLIGDGVGGVYVAWQDERAGAADIYAIRLTSSATVVNGWGSAAPGLPICTLAGNQYAPSVSLGFGGVLLVAWSDARTSPVRVYAQKVSAAGSVLWTTNGVPVSGTGEGGVTQDSPAILSDGVGGAYLTYVEGNGTIHIQRALTGNGANGFSTFPVDNSVLYPNGASTATDNLPRLVSDGGSGVIVVYTALTGSGDIRAAHVDPADPPPNPAWNVVVCGASGAQARPNIVSDSDGGAIISWSDERVAGSRALYLSRLLPDGSLASGWPADGRQVASSMYIYGPRPALAQDGYGGAVLTWATPPGDIQATVVRSCGTVSTVTAICNDGLEQLAPAIVNEGGNAALVWIDSRGSGTQTAVFSGTLAIPAMLNFGVGNGSEMQVVTWTGPATQPHYGDPTSFDVFQSSAPFTESNLASATLLGTLGVNGPPGTQYCVPVNSLTQCTPYYYAVRFNFANCSAFVKRSSTTKCFGGIELQCNSSLAYRPKSEAAPAPVELSLSAARPSPSRDVARFALAIPPDLEGADLRIGIYDLLGRRVREVLHESAKTGFRELAWRLDSDSGSRVPGGVYFARMQVGSRRMTRTVVVGP